MIEVALLGALLSPLAKLFLEKMASGELVDFFRSRKSTAKLLEQLKIKLLSVSAVLEDAEDKQVTNHDVKKWLDELNDAVYVAEDILDKIATEASQHQLDAEFQASASKVRNLVSASLNLFVKGIDSAIEEVLERLEFLANQKDNMNLRAGVGGKLSESYTTTSSIPKSGVFGRDDDKEVIVNWLVSNDARDNDENCVIAVVGLGGIGKTTLAQLVYNDYNRVEENFKDLKAWFCVSEEFDMSKVMKSIIEAVTKLPCGIEDPDQLKRTVEDNLKGKKFLLVLDDVCTEKQVHQEFLSELLQYGAQGSKIIITTWDESVARTMHAIKIHNLKELPEENCWSLFAKHAFRNGRSSPHSELEKIGHKIVEKCKGLPLAIKAIGNLLWSELDVEKWDKILKSKLWDLPIDKTGILPALRLSYKYLPSHLKRCFVYCSIFPKDYAFEKDDIIFLWMAEGLLQQSENETMEEVGNSYFFALVSRSLFQQSSDKKSSFVMHDLVNDLAKYLAGPFCQTLQEGDNSREIVKMTRHLSYYGACFDSFEKIDEALAKTKQLRTFLALHKSLLWSKKMDGKVLHNLQPVRCLRVLSLTHFPGIRKLPTSISKMRHLRFLDLSFSRIERLPNSVCKLFNLQILKLSGCKYLVELPSDTCKLVNLRHLDITETRIKEMPRKLGSLKYLRTLTTFVISKHGGSCIAELGKLKNIRGKLSILELQNVVSPTKASDASLKDRMYLEELVLKWNAPDTNISSKDQQAVFDCLQPHTGLKSLSIVLYNGESFPDWVGHPSFCSITSLHLYDCAYCVKLPPLGQLPSLEELSIVRVDAVITVGFEFYSTAGSSSLKPFGALKVLRFESMSNWKEWCPFDTESEGKAFSRLKELYIEKCPMLTGPLPIHLSSLDNLEITGCSQLVNSLPSALLASLPRAPAMRELATKNGSKRWLLLKELPTGMRKLEIEKFDKLESLEGMIDANNWIQELKLTDCWDLTSLCRDGLPSTLRSVLVYNCSELELPMDLCYSSLERLELSACCGSLTSFPLDLFPKLSTLVIAKCRLLESLTVQEGYEHNLVISSLSISDCINFASFPEGGLRAPNLKQLSLIYCDTLSSLPDNMHLLLTSLRKLHIEECRGIEWSPEKGLPPSLQEIEIDRCHDLWNRMRWGLQELPSLRALSIGGKLESIVSFPEAGLLPASLNELYIYDCPWLKSLNQSGFQGLSALRRLEIRECPRLEYIPDLPATLSHLWISDCPLLTKQWESKRGKEWRKIAHVPRKIIDRQWVK